MGFNIGHAVVDPPKAVQSCEKPDEFNTREERTGEGGPHS